jgi:anhydro-N-acetylmuramic acid kinase
MDAALDPINGVYAGLMSGTSLDGVDAALARFEGGRPRLLALAHRPMPPDLRARLLAASRAGGDSLDEVCRLAVDLAGLYAEAIEAATARSRLGADEVVAIGCHGQTVRHRPECGYTAQIVNAALLAERCGIDVICDFRSADIAAGGQGAPLAPGFHAAALSHPAHARVVLNLGGIANVTWLAPGQPVRGFDTGPASMLLDAWTQRHLGTPFDRDGEWALGGRLLPALLDRLLADPWFDRPPPRSTGREQFDLPWLEARLSGTEAPADVQATLLLLTARSVAQAIARYCPGSAEVLVCGGGARNRALMAALATECAPARVSSVDDVGFAAEAVEALAFAWLARQHVLGLPGNLPEVTGARGSRVLGARYPAPRSL